MRPLKKKKQVKFSIVAVPYGGFGLFFSFILFYSLYFIFFSLYTTLTTILLCGGFLSLLRLLPDVEFYLLLVPFFISFVYHLYSLIVTINQIIPPK